MAIFTVTDKKDGSGATFVITGVTGTAKLYVSHYSGNVDRNCFEAKITTVVDVTQDVAFPIGVYNAVLVDEGGPVPPVTFRVTDDDIGFHEKCLNAMRDHIMALHLSSFPRDPEKYKLYRRPINTFSDLREAAGQDIHGVHFWKRPEERPIVGTNSEWDIAYVVEYVLVASSKLSNKTDYLWTLDRERILRSFGVCPLPAVPEVFTVEVYPGVLYQDNVDPGVDCQAMQFHCRMYQPVTYNI